MTEQKKRMLRCCFTGHRPEKLGIPEQQVIQMLRDEIILAVDSGFITFVTGMARGVDLWAAEEVIKQRNKNKSIHLICACPYDGFEQHWSEPWKQRYHNVMQSADLIRFSSKHYDPGCFQRRNEWMVDHSARVIAVYNGTAGGTRNTIQYAHGKSEIRMIRL